MGEDGLGSVVGRVVTDAKTYVAAEVALWKAVATTRGSQAGIAVGLAIGAMLIVLSALTALLVGAIFALAPVTGPLWATLLVVVGALLIAAVLAGTAVSGFKRVGAPLGGDS